MEKKIRAAGIAVLSAGIGGCVLTLIYLAFAIFARSVGVEMARRAGMPKEFIDQMEQARGSTPILDVAWSLISLGVYAFVAFGGSRMIHVRSWSIALAAAIALVVPCCVPCCCSLGLVIPIGVWALIVLLNADVKKAFKP